MVQSANIRPTSSTARRVVNFDAGKTGRRLKAIPTTTESINSQIRKYGKNVLARSRHLCANNAYASAAKEAFVASLVGGGIKPASLLTDQPDLKRAIQELWYDWTDEADADNVTDFYGMQAIIARELFEAGEVFVRFRPRRASDGFLLPFQLQILPSEMLPLNYYDLTTAGRRIECGIEFNGIGQRQAYHFLRNHPGELYRFTPDSSMVTVVPASEVMHLYLPTRAGQIRGVPHSLSAIAVLALLDLYDDAELERKRITSLFAGFVTRNDENGGHPLENEDDPSNTDYVNDFGANTTPMEPGAMVDLEPGEDIKFASPADVGGNYDAFEYRNLLRAASGFGVPYADMTGDLRQVNYSSMRSGLLQFRRRITMLQHQVMVFQFNRPVWQRFMDEGVTAGEIPLGLTEYLTNARKYRRAKWIPPKWEWIDPLKDRQAEEVAVKNNWKSRDDVIEEEGYDPEEVDARIAASQKRLKDEGIEQPTPPPPSNPPPPNQPPPDPTADPADPNNPINDPAEQ